MSKRKRDDSNAAATDLVATWNPPDEGNLVSATILPAITRKITACSACRKQKIKCIMPTESPPCERCKRRGISCVLNKSLQALLDDQKQTELLQVDVRNLHDTIARLCQQLSCEPPQSLVSTCNEASEEHIQRANSDTDREHDDACELSPPSSPSAVQAPIDTFLDIAKLGSPTSTDTPASFRQRRQASQQDLVTKGIISLKLAEVLVERYFSRLDHYLYGIASHFKDIHGLRQASPFLFAAICTVSALHDPKEQRIYDACNREYRRLISRSMFEKRDVEYLRGLCIGSFWLADASRILSSDAVRRAADARLHRHFYHVVNPQTMGTSPSDSQLSQVDFRDRIRLWYLLFVCDQHLSILHNRDGVVRHEKEPLVGWDTYLNSEGTTDSDVRVMSQVGLLLIMSQVREAFGSEHPEQVPRSSAVQLNHFAKQLDEWYQKFSALFKPNPYIGDFPRKGLQMHYQFGKLYLGQHVFRGLKEDPIPIHFLSQATLAYEAALSIFEMILQDPKLQESLVGVPHYFHIMIAFGGCFLLELCAKHAEQLMIDVDKCFQLLDKVLAALGGMASIPQHPIHRLATGLRRKLVETATKTGKATSLDANVVDLGHVAVTSSSHPRQLNTEIDRRDPMLSNGNQMSPDTPFGFTMGSLPTSVDDLSYPDFGDFNFPDMRLNFYN